MGNLILQVKSSCYVSGTYFFHELEVLFLLSNDLKLGILAWNEIPPKTKCILQCLFQLKFIWCSQVKGSWGNFLTLFFLSYMNAHYAKRLIPKLELHCFFDSSAISKIPFSIFLLNCTVTAVVVIHYYFCSYILK